PPSRSTYANWSLRRSSRSWLSSSLIVRLPCVPDVHRGIPRAETAVVDNRAWIGTSGFEYAHWRGGFYAGVPRPRWLEHYAGEFDTVELNATFYRLPRAEAFERWAGRVPDTFRFAVKASRYLTHMK